MTPHPTIKNPSQGILEQMPAYAIDDEIVKVGSTYLLPSWLPSSMSVAEIQLNAIPFSELSKFQKVRVKQTHSVRLKLALLELRVDSPVVFNTNFKPFPGKPRS